MSIIASFSELHDDSLTLFIATTVSVIDLFELYATKQNCKAAIYLKSIKCLVV